MVQDVAQRFVGRGCVAMLYHADNSEVLGTLDACHSCVTDPPYGLKFMGKRWDYDVPTVEQWELVLGALRPGGHLLSFAGTRTHHRMCCRIEDAGFEIRDMIAWVYGSGFPKSLDVSKAIDREDGIEREVVGKHSQGFRASGSGLEGCQRPSHANHGTITIPSTTLAKQWSGWGTALKPAIEPITVARKPLIGTVAENVQKHGTGGINVDGCRVGMRSDNESGWSKTGSKAGENRSMNGANYARGPKNEIGIGRWPANLIHDGSEEVVEMFPETSISSGGKAGHTGAYCGGFRQEHYGNLKPGFGDSGSAARFFYCAKASKAERDAGCDCFDERNGSQDYRPNDDGEHGIQSRLHGATVKGRNNHPTVKPIALMRYLCRLVTPPGGIVLDPWMGSGSTGIAAMREGFNFIGIEKDESSYKIACARIANELEGVLI